MFEITKLLEQHTCFYFKLSQNHVQLDFLMMDRDQFCEGVKKKRLINIAQLLSNIKTKFGYHMFSITNHRIIQEM